MKEFFIARQWRRRGIGAQAVRLLLDRFTGRWLITEHQRNTSRGEFLAPRSLGLHRWPITPGSASSTARFTSASSPDRDALAEFFAQQRLQVMPGDRLGLIADRFRRAGGHDPAATLSTFRSQIDHVARGLDDIEIVFDDHQRIARIAQLLQPVEQLRDVVKVQTGRGFIQDV